MTAKKARYIGNMFGAPDPAPGAGLAKGLFAAGASVAIAEGEILEKTGNSNTEWVPWDSDFAASANLAVAFESIKSGDLAGYYWIYVLRPGDIFEFALAAASAIALGTALYFSDSVTFTVTPGTNIVARSVGTTHYPANQGHTSDDASASKGTTIKSTSTVHVCFKQSVTYFSALQT